MIAGLSRVDGRCANSTAPYSTARSASCTRSAALTPARHAGSCALLLIIPPSSISFYPTQRGVWGGKAPPRPPFARRRGGGAAARTPASEPKGSFGGPLALQTSRKYL